MLKNKKLFFINLAVIMGLIFVVVLGKQHLAESRSAFIQEETEKVVVKNKISLIANSNPFKSTFILPFKDQTDFDKLFAYGESVEIEEEVEELDVKDELIEDDTDDVLENLNSNIKDKSTNESNTWQPSNSNQFSGSSKSLGNPTKKKSETNSSKNKKNENSPTIESADDEIDKEVDVTDDGFPSDEVEKPEEEPEEEPQEDGDGQEEVTNEEDSKGKADSDNEE